MYWRTISIDMFDLELRLSRQMFTDYVDLIIPRALLDILGARRTSTSCSVFSTKTETEALTSKCGPAYFQIFKNTFSRSSWLQQICAVLVTQRASLGMEQNWGITNIISFSSMFFSSFGRSCCGLALRGLITSFPFSFLVLKKKEKIAKTDFEAWSETLILIPTLTMH